MLVVRIEVEDAQGFQSGHALGMELPSPGQESSALDDLAFLNLNKSVSCYIVFEGRELKSGAHSASDRTPNRR